MKLLSLLGLHAALLAHQVAAWGTTTEDITYILPIYEGALADGNRDGIIAILEQMKSKLGVGGSHTKLGFSFSSWSLSRDIEDASADYVFNSSNLNYVLGIAEATNLPVLIHANNGRWADCCTSNSDGGYNDALLDHIASQPITVMVDSSGNNQYGHDAGSNYFSFSRYNSVYRSYKKRNVQASMAVLAAWAAAHPSLFVGISLDSETLFPSDSSDFNPNVIKEWKEWLQNTGIYGPGGDYFGQGRVPAFTSISQFNQATGQSFASWDNLRPPNSITWRDPFSEEWHRFRITLIEHEVADETQWIAEAGIPRSVIYGHQTPELQFYPFADDLATATAANGAGGLTTYGRAPLDYGSVDNPIRGDGSNNWGIFELNPLTNDATTSYNTMVTLFNDGIKVACPNAWEVVAKPDTYAMFNSPDHGNVFGNAVNQFMTNYGNTPRNLAPPPWNPGNVVFDLFDAFGSATSSGADNHVAASGTSGGIARKVVYEAVGGQITYKTKLPAVASGQRLNFKTDVGIRDGAGAGGTATWQVTINGSPLFGSGLILAPTYWFWKRWQPVMVDVTFWAGQDVTIVLTTSGNDVYGWTQWGSPAIYASVADIGSNNLALGKPVSVSSSDGIGAGWDATYLTDGNVVGGTNGRNGWSSAGHSAAAATEWAQVDLGSSRSVSRVVLHPRSDVANAASTGFPTQFSIQGSTDGSSWTTFVSQSDYGGVKAGHAQVFTFPAATARYVRVVGTQLGGVAQESFYRIQLTELEVYA